MRSECYAGSGRLGVSGEHEKTFRENSRCDEAASVKAGFKRVGFIHWQAVVGRFQLRFESVAQFFE